MRPLRFARLLTFLMLVLPGAMSAQDVASGSFVGVVRDTSGGVLPGVVVEAASPALIEKARTDVTDGEGRYRIAGLRPGLYSVTFSLPAFTTVRREGIELTSGFIASVNAELGLGSVEETITVSGAAPMVDVRDSSQQQVFSGEVVRALPIAKNNGAFVMLLPGAVQNNLTHIDVGGTKGETENGIAIHGGRPNDYFTLREGLYDHNMFGQAQNGISSINPVTIQEVNLQLTGGLTAEAMTGGVQRNVVLRDGGNTISGSFQTDFSNRHLQANNLDDALRARGAGIPAYLKTNHDFAGGIGGAIVKDKLWFFADARYWKSYNYYPGNYYNTRQGSLFYERDLARPGYSGTYTKSAGARLTWQASQKHKISFTGHKEDGCNCFFQVANGALAPEASGSDRYSPYALAHVNWTYPITNQLMVEAGMIGVGGIFWRDTTGSTDSDISVLDLSRNYRYGAPALLARRAIQQVNTAGSVSYVTGSHALKFGYLYLLAGQDVLNRNNNSISYTFIGTVPQSVTYYAYPVTISTRLNQIALYAHDQWSLSNLTLNLGMRMDRLSGHSPAVHSEAGRWVPARDFSSAHDTPNWKDLSPRIGAAYNVFGNDQTVIKVNLGRYPNYEPLGGVATTANRANATVVTANRTWRDANGDYVPQDTELGPLSNPNFGNTVVVTRLSDDVLHGFNVRPYSWQGSVSVQRELRSGVAVNIGYFRTWYGNFRVTDNLLVAPPDYQSYCITAPTNAQLPGGGGEQICGVMDITPAKFGRVDNLVKQASDYGGQTEVYDGFDFTMNARFLDGGLLTGGLSTSKTVTDNCHIVAQLPEMATTAAPMRFCKVSPPWSAATQVKLSGSYPLPWGFRSSAAYMNIPGLPTTATYVATTASNPEIVSQLGRPLASGANGTASVELIAPRSLYREGRISMVNLTVGKSFRFGRTRVEPKLELFNALNANPLEAVNLQYGPAWQNVIGILPPRMVKLGVRVDY